ncbi:expressed unknown protein [Ectocarpus siliculosus]|uniref:Uncharacterized protein n=1 Tax=Ectocarpus siliculosus TaxID=2880 RepID=D7G5M4_ECTSI|nr:expressed unknown protein [Ectocarpus siliculosus]|eukprot:CBJ33870.1 expressed unknown protein [Ectocarpus siliculosus]
MALLFLLVGLVAADDVRLANEEGGMGTTMRRALTTSTSECAAELSACSSDTSCTTCVTEFLSKEEECSTEVSLCEDVQDAVCCTLADEEENCETDTTFGNFLECIFEELFEALIPQCGDNLVDISDCNGAAGLASSWGVSTVLGFTTVAGLLVATFGFVV